MSKYFLQVTHRLITNNLEIPGQLEVRAGKTMESGRSDQPQTPILLEQIVDEYICQ